MEKQNHLPKQMEFRFFCIKQKMAFLLFFFFQKGKKKKKKDILQILRLTDNRNENFRPFAGG